MGVFEKYRKNRKKISISQTLLLILWGVYVCVCKEEKVGGGGREMNFLIRGPFFPHPCDHMGNLLFPDLHQNHFPHVVPHSLWTSFCVAVHPSIKY